MLPWYYLKCKPKYPSSIWNTISNTPVSNTLVKFNSRRRRTREQGSHAAPWPVAAAVAASTKRTDKYSVTDYRSGLLRWSGAAMENASLPSDVGNDATTSSSLYLADIRYVAVKVVYIIIGTVGVLDNLFVLVIFALFVKIADKVFRRCSCLVRRHVKTRSRYIAERSPSARHCSTVGLSTLNPFCASCSKFGRQSAQMSKIENGGLDQQWRIQPGARGPCPPVGGLAIFCQYINIIIKPTAYDGPREY